MKADDQADQFCTECGLEVADGTAGCQRLFEEVIAREFGDYRYGRLHRLTVDSYALQHPEKYMHSAKSFAAHLTGMYAAMEHESDPARTREVNAAVQSG